MKKLALITVLLGSSVALTACADTPTQTEQTKPEAPDFKAYDKDGKLVKLSDLKGKKVYINFWASWCDPCIREAPELEKIYPQVKEDVVFLSITSPSDKDFKNTNPLDKDQETITNKAKELGITYPVLFDTEDDFIASYEVRSLPTHIFVNSDGTLSNRVPGGLSSQTLLKEIKKLK